MTIWKLAAILGAIAATLPCPAASSAPEQGPKQAFAVTSTQTFKFLPGGSIRLDNSYGYVAVEGWDEPEVEVTVTKSTNHYYKSAGKAEANQRLDLVHVSVERHSDTELSVTTARGSRGVSVDYRIRVPRNSRLVIHNRTGYVWVSEVTNDIEAHSRTGDMTVSLIDPGSYSIDAKSKLGSVSSDVNGKGGRPWLTGSRLVHEDPAPAHHIYLRVGMGSIEILKGPSIGYFGH
jgi:hypothetical protein